MSLLELFCSVDDFWMTFVPAFHEMQVSDGRRRLRSGQMHESEIMTILIHFHQSHYRTFKAYYTEYVQHHLASEFPSRVRYQRFVELTPQMLVPLLAYLNSLYGSCTGISFIDSTGLAVCHPKRIPQHRVFAAEAARGKTSVGWFYGFKLHLAVNDHGELLACCLTPGNVDDRRPVPKLAKRLGGKLFGDRGYISAALVQTLFQHGLQLITKLKKNMANRLLTLTDKLLLRKRAIIETIIDQLKNISQIEHSRHRSPTNFVVNVLCGLIAYCHQPKNLPCTSTVGLCWLLEILSLSRTHVKLRRNA